MANQHDGSGTRRTPRRIFNRLVGVLCAGEYELATSLQLSEGGMLFAAGRKFEIGTAVVVTINLPGGKSAVASGEILYEIKRGNGPQYGVKFHNLDLAQRRLIRNYVSAKTQAEAEAERYEGDPRRKRLQ